MLREKTLKDFGRFVNVVSYDIANNLLIFTVKKFEEVGKITVKIFKGETSCRCPLDSCPFYNKIMDMNNLTAEKSYSACLDRVPNIRQLQNYGSMHTFNYPTERILIFYVITSLKLLFKEARKKGLVPAEDWMKKNQYFFDANFSNEQMISPD